MSKISFLSRNWVKCEYTNMKHILFVWLTRHNFQIIENDTSELAWESSCFSVFFCIKVIQWYVSVHSRLHSTRELLWISTVKCQKCNIQWINTQLLFFFLQSRAKQLYNAGYKTLTHLANADPAVLSKTIENLYKKQANQIVASAKVSVMFTCPQFLEGFKITSLIW